MKKISALIILIYGIAQTIVCVWIALLLIPVYFGLWGLKEILGIPNMSVNNKGQLNESPFLIHS